jgi:pSer/pThr/pTyr-binding forkhead associated (FHA) protein
MRVILEVITGPDAGRKVRLAAGQVLQVGRTNWADLAITQDARMADVHFALKTDFAACFIKNIDQDKGTQVNGQQLVAEAELRHGDKILAGDTLFVVHVEEAAAVPRTAAPPHPDHAVGPRPGPATEPPRPGLAPVPAPIATGGAQGGAVKLTYTFETCDTGLTLCRGQVDDIEPHELAVALSQVFPPFLIVDFKKLECGKPQEIGSPDYLFDWLDSNAAAVFSPVVLSPGDYPAWPVLIEKGWGEDAVICLFSRQKKSALLDHLRLLCRGELNPGGKGRAIVGYCWPSVMAPLLAHYTKDFVRRLIEGIDAVLVELPDLPITWQIYSGNGHLAEALDRLGFVREEPEETEKESEEATP